MDKDELKRVAVENLTYATNGLMWKSFDELSDEELITAHRHAQTATSALQKLLVERGIK